MLHISYKTLAPICFIYIALPLLCFAGAWLSPLWSIILSSGLVIAGIVPMIQKRKEYDAFPLPLEMTFKHSNQTANSHMIEMKWTTILALAIICVIIAILTGQGGIWFQSEDWDVRNAIYRDLIYYDYPVVYDGGYGLVYYIGYWLPPAAFMKMVSLVVSDAILLWNIAKIVLLIWTVIGLILSSLLLLLALRIRKQWIMLAIPIFFIFFSLPEAIGAAIFPADENMAWPWSLWSWNANVQYGGNLRHMSWAFNQACMAWVCIGIFLNERNLRNYFVIGAACFISAPFPCVGLFVLMFVHAILCVIHGKKLHGSYLAAVKGLAKISSIISLIMITAIALYFISCSAVQNPEIANAMVRPEGTQQIAYDFTTVTIDIVKALLTQAAIFLIPIAIKRKQCPLFWAMAVSLAILPYFHVGGAIDFCIRSTIPATTVIFAYTVQILRECISEIKNHGKEVRFSTLLIVIALSLGSILGIYGCSVDITQYMNNLDLLDKNHEMYDSLGSIANKDLEVSNFSAPDIQNTVFGQIFGKY